MRSILRGASRLEITFSALNVDTSAVNTIGLKAPLFHISMNKSTLDLANLVLMIAGAKPQQPQMGLRQADILRLEHQTVKQETKSVLSY